MQTVTGFRGFPLEEVLGFPLSLVFVYFSLNWNLTKDILASSFAYVLVGEM